MLPAIDALIPSLSGFIFAAILTRRDLALFNDFTILLLFANLFAAVGLSFYSTPIHYQNIPRYATELILRRSTGVLLATKLSFVVISTLPASHWATSIGSVILAVTASISANTIRSLILKSQQLLKSIIQAGFGVLLANFLILSTPTWTANRPDRILAIYTLVHFPRLFAALPSFRRPFRVSSRTPLSLDQLHDGPPMRLRFLTFTLFAALTGTNILVSLFFARTLSEQSFAAVRIAELSIAPIAVYLSANIAYLTNSKWSKIEDRRECALSARHTIIQLRRISGLSLMPATALGLFLSNGVVPTPLFLLTFFAYVPTIYIQGYLPIHLNLLMIRGNYSKVLKLCTIRVFSVTVVLIFAITLGLSVKSFVVPLIYFTGSLPVLGVLHVYRKRNDP